MIPPHPWYMNRLYQDSQNANYRGTQAKAIPLSKKHFAYATTHIATSASKKKSPVGPTDLGSPSDLSNWLIDTGATAHMTPCLNDLVNVEKGPDVSIEVADGTTVPCQGKGTGIINTNDDDGHPIRLKLPTVLYVPGLTKRLFSVYQFTKNITNSARIHRQFITLIYNSDRHITVPLYQGAPSACQVETTTEVPSKPYSVKNKTAVTSELLHKRLGHRPISTIITASQNNLW